MILSQRQLEEIAASTTKDFNRFFFGDEADKPDRSALPTPIDQFAKNYLGLRVSFARLSPDGSICGVTAYADTEYKITELGITRTLVLKRKVMQILRAEEKRLRRSKQGVPISGTEGKTAEERASVLSLSYVSYEGCEDLEPYWLIDSSSMEESVMFWMSEKEFRATLTPKQLDIYLNCIIGGQSKIDYAAANNMQRQSVYNAATLIMKKAKYFFKKF